MRSRAGPDSCACSPLLGTDPGGASPSAPAMNQVMKTDTSMYYKRVVLMSAPLRSLRETRPRLYHRVSFKAKMLILCRIADCQSEGIERLSVAATAAAPGETGTVADDLQNAGSLGRKQTRAVTFLTIRMDPPSAARGLGWKIPVNIISHRLETS